jgi:hypothetical protein
MNGINAPQRPDCVAGHVRFDLRNVDANYPFEKSRRFAGNQPNSGHGDHSRLSCGAGDTQLGPGGQHPAPSRTRWSKDDPPVAKPSTPLLSLRWTFRAKRACVVITDAEPDRLALSPRQRRWASAGFGWWRRAVAPTLPARCCADALERRRLYRSLRHRSLPCPRRLHSFLQKVRLFLCLMALRVLFGIQPMTGQWLQSPYPVTLYPPLKYMRTSPASDKFRCQVQAVRL